MLRINTQLMANKRSTVLSVAERVTVFQALLWLEPPVSFFAVIETSLAVFLHVISTL